jgi:hypothetical protein
VAIERHALSANTDGLMTLTGPVHMHSRRSRRSHFVCLFFSPLPFMSEVSALHSSSYLNHSPGPSNTDPEASATDPAQLLRQAALSTRKLKRRRLDASASIASFSRPLSRSFASTSSIFLDYGQEELPSTPPTSEQPPPVLPVTAPPKASTPIQTLASRSPSRSIHRGGSSSGAAPQTPLDDDAPTREEGEISENEDPPFRPPERSIPVQPTTVTEAIYTLKLESSGSVQPRSPLVLASRSPSEDAYQLAIPPSSVAAPARTSGTEAPPVALETQSSSESFRLETPLYVLDATHVRPGLSRTCIFISHVIIVRPVF